MGVIYPDSTTATNTYAVQGNLLLTTGTEANLKSVVQNLYNVLKNVTYTPCKVSVPSSSGPVPASRSGCRASPGR